MTACMIGRLRWRSPARVGRCGQCIRLDKSFPEELNHPKSTNCRCGPWHPCNSRCREDWNHLRRGQRPSKELAALCHERWEIETTLDELKTHLRGAQIVLRSKTPELVRQEFFGLLMVHFAIRGLMHEAALWADEDPDRLSFVHSVHVVQRRMARYGSISPSAEKSLPPSDPGRNS